MASPPFNPDESIPADNAIIANFPAIYRAMVDIFESWLLVEHDRQGHNVFQIDTTTNRDGGTWGDGALFFNTTVGALQFRRDASWDTISLASGTVAVFNQSTAPTGWTKDTEAGNNHALRVVTGNASSGGSVDFTDAFKSQAVAGTVGNTSLTVAQLPSHTHPVTYTTTQVGSGAFIAGFVRPGDAGANSSETLSRGSGQAHTHSFTGTAIDMAVKYVDVIRATKD